MLNKRHNGQGVIWVILIVAIVALIALWISKNPSSTTTTTAPTENESITPTSEISLTPTPTQSLMEIEKALKDLNTGSSDIDKSLNDSQLDINQ